MLISRTAIRGYLERDFANYYWMKRLSRSQLLSELGGLRLKPDFKTEPWLHQLVCFYIGLCEPGFLFHLDMGLGKSKIILDLIRHRQRGGRLKRALVGVPRLVNIDSWLDDVERHSVLEPNGILVEGIEEKWQRLSEPTGDLTIIDYQGLALATCINKRGRLVKSAERIEKLQSLYNFIAYDEIHKLKNWDSLWFSIARDLSARADWRYGATGTLFGREVEDLHPQFYLIDEGETFGENTGLFLKSFFQTKTHEWKGTEFIFDRKMSRHLHHMLAHRSIRYDDSEVQEIPKMQFIPIRLDMGDEQRGHFMRALEGVINAKGGDPAKLEAPWIKMRQIVSGYLRWKDEHGEHIIFFKDNPKLRALERLIDEMGDSKIVISYEYTPSGRLISERLTELKVKHEWFYGGTKDKPASRRRFLDDPETRVFLMNSEAGGTGTDGLQKVARYLVLYESPSSPITRKQVIKRVHRSEQRQRSFAYDLIMRRSGDQKILDSIAEGHDLYEMITKGGVDRGWFLS